MDLNIADNEYYFTPKDQVEGLKMVIGDVNRVKSKDRWDIETEIVTKHLLPYIQAGDEVLDYGCGVGRLSSKISEDRICNITGADLSNDMLRLAAENVRERFRPIHINGLTDEIQYDFIICSYVLQHVRAIDLRDVLRKLHRLLKDKGCICIATSNIRMAVTDMPDSPFFDDRSLGVNIHKEIKTYFQFIEELIPDDIIKSEPVLNEVLNGYDKHTIRIYRKR